MASSASTSAIPLGKLRPRQGRYSRVWQAVLAFALYANLALIARSWLTRGVTSPKFGIWWVHLLFIALGALLVWGAALRRTVFTRGAQA
jgi:lipopolysaccharide export system permease protein